MDSLREYQTEVLSAWSGSQLCAWVQGISRQSGWREDYSQGFRSHEIDGRCIRELTSELLREMGVLKIGHRLTLLREIRKLSGLLTDPTTTVLPTPSSNQRYTVPQSGYPLPIYMPQQSNYNANCFTRTMQQEHQPQPMVQPTANGRTNQDLPVEPAPVQYSEAKTDNMRTPESSEEKPQKADETEQDVVDNHQMLQQQQVNEEDDFPNAQNLEPLPSDGAMVHQTETTMVNQTDIAPQEHTVDQQNQSFVEDVQSVPNEGGIDVQQPVMKPEHAPQEKIVEPSTLAGQVQSRPSAWGSKNRLRITPQGSTTPNKLLVQTTRSNKFSTRSPPQDKRYNKPTEVISDEPQKPIPQAGDILKGTVKRVIAGLGAFIDINGPGDALLTNKEGVISFRIEVPKTYWVMVKKVADPNPNPSSKGQRIHLTSFIPGVSVQGTISHPHPASGARQIGFFVNIGWWKPGLLLLKRMRDKNRKKHQQLNTLFVLSHKLKVIRNQQSTAELDLTEIEPQNWKSEDVCCWLESFFNPGERLPETLRKLNGKDILSLKPQVLDQLGLTDPHKKERILLSVKMMTEQRAYLTQRTKKQHNNSASNKPQRRSEVPSPPTGDSHFPALGNKGRRR